MLANQLDIVVVYRKQNETVVTDIAVPSDRNIKKDGYEKLERYQDPKEELLDKVVVGVLGIVASQISETLSLFFFKSLTREITEVECYC